MYRWKKWPQAPPGYMGSLRDREVACSASDRQGSNFESCVWRTVSSQSSHHPQEVLLAQFSLYVHKGGLKPDPFHFPPGYMTTDRLLPTGFTRVCLKWSNIHVSPVSAITRQIPLYTLTCRAHGAVATLNQRRQILTYKDVPRVYLRKASNLSITITYMLKPPYFTDMIKFTFEPAIRTL